MEANPYSSAVQLERIWNSLGSARNHEPSTSSACPKSAHSCGWWRKQRKPVNIPEPCRAQHITNTWFKYQRLDRVTRAACQHQVLHTPPDTCSLLLSSRQVLCVICHQTAALYVRSHANVRSPGSHDFPRNLMRILTVHTREAAACAAI